jgi:hypothetical protein
MDNVQSTTHVYWYTPPPLSLSQFTIKLDIHGKQFYSSPQPPAHAGSSLADFSTLKMEAIRSSETSFHTRSTRRHIPEDDILHSHRRENLKSYHFIAVPSSCLVRK